MTWAMGWLEEVGKLAEGQVNVWGATSSEWGPPVEEGRV